MVEIERKFIVDRQALLQDLLDGNAHVIEKTEISQAYLILGDGGYNVRVRISKRASDSELNDELPGEGIEIAEITAKTGEGMVKTEINSGITLQLARTLTEHSLCKLRKIRYVVQAAGNRWDVDLYPADPNGLHVAEIELDSVDQQFDRPSWVKQELTGLKAYSNIALAKIYS
jgi:adenylate cyclase